MSRGINLIAINKDDKQRSLIGGRLRIFRLSAIALLFCVGALSVIISILIVFSPLPQLREEEEKARNNLSVFRLDINKLAFVNDRGDSIRQVLKSRNSYDKKLSIIKSKMPADVVFDGMTLVKKRYTLSFSSNNLSSLDELLNSIVVTTGKSRDFSKAYLTSLSVETEKHSFVMVVDLLAV